MRGNKPGLLLVTLGVILILTTCAPKPTLETPTPIEATSKKPANASSLTVLPTPIPMSPTPTTLVLLAPTAMMLPTPTLPMDTPTPPVPIPQEVVEYDIRQTVTLVNDGSAIATRILLWVALLRDIEPYQEVLSMQITPQDFETTTDEYGNLYAAFEFNDVASREKVSVEIRYRVAVNKLDFALSNCEGPLPGVFVDPEPYLDSDAEQIIALAQELAEGKVTACEKVEAFYNYVGDNVSYTGYDPEDKGGLSTLEDLAGDCTDFADLLIALSRAAGVPARFIEGITCCTNGDYIEGEIKHDWLEAYLPGTGWAPMDPTFGRFPLDREKYFAGITPDHIVVTQGRSPSILEGYHYYFYKYWWEVESTEVSAQDEWMIVRIEE